MTFTLPRKHAFGALTALLVTALGAAACGDPMTQDEPAPDCAKYTSCGTCTPVVGCGWCFDDHGGGTCLSGPSACTAAGSKWNWDPAGCHAPADASTLGDGAPEADASSDAASCHFPPAANTYSDAGDAGTGCLPSLGGTLCEAASYQLSCYGTGPGDIPLPDHSLGCIVVPMPTPSNALFYCCPCSSGASGQ